MRKRQCWITGLILGAVAAVLAATPAFAQWPTTCVELNDIVEAHLGNDHNVGIYQRVFGDQSEAACQQDHGDDVRSVFAWAIGEEPVPEGSLHGSNDVVRQVQIPSGLYIFSARYNPNRNFIVHVVGQRTEYLFNQLRDIGYTETTLRLGGGTYFIEVEASGAWTIEWRQVAA